MMHNALRSEEEVPYRFSRSSVKFYGHTWQKISSFDPNNIYIYIWTVTRAQSQQFESNLNKITRPVAFIKSIRFALFAASTGVYSDMFCIFYAAVFQF